MPLNICRQKGAMLITSSLWFITLIGFAALAFDIGHLLIVRNELQNGADAAALSGANCLNKKTAGSGTECTKEQSPTLNWAIASTVATDFIGRNKSDGTSLVNGTVQTGYWDINGGAALQATTLSPLGPCTITGGVMTTPCDKPAVMVTISRSSGNNGGAVGTLIAAMFGGDAIPISASAVAVISSPGNVLPGTLIPQAINKCMFDNYWDVATGSPKIYNGATGDPLNPYNLSTAGKPYTVRIGSSYHYPDCFSAGQWTSFDLGSASAAVMKDLIDTGNKTSLSIANGRTCAPGVDYCAYIQPGTKAVGYKDLDNKYPTPPGADVTVVVVDTADLTTPGQVPIVAFAGFHITDIQGGSEKYIQGHFIKGATTSGSSGIGPYYGTYTPPRLAQ